MVYFSLLRRRQEWHKHKLEEEAAKPDSTVPDGHVKMSVQDKQITLQTLENGINYSKCIFWHVSKVSQTFLHVQIKFHNGISAIVFSLLIF